MCIIKHKEGLHFVLAVNYPDSGHGRFKTKERRRLENNFPVTNMVAARVVM